MDVNEELHFFVKIQKKIIFFWGGGGVGSGGQGGCEIGIEVFGKMDKKKFLGGGSRGGGSGWGGVRMDVNEELKFL